MLKLLNKLHARDAKVAEKVDRGENSNYIFMTFNQGDSFPIVVPPKSKNVCIEGTACDLFR